MLSSFTIESWGVRARVEWNCPSLDAAVRGLLLPTWRERPELQPRDVFALTTGPGGELILRGPDLDLRPNRKDIVESLERHLHMFLACHSPVAIYLHAGVLEWKGKAIVLPGISYSGKTTLVQELVRLGARFYSDEYAIIDTKGRVHPFPRPLSIREGPTARRVDATELGWPLALPPEGLELGSCFFLKYRTGQSWQVTEKERGEGLLGMMGNTVSARLAPELALRCLSAASEGVRFWEGTRGSAEDAAPEILRRL